MSGQGQSPATRQPSPGQDKVRLEVVAGGSSPHCLLVSVLGVYLCVTTCTGARDPTESPLSQVRCGVLSMCGVPSSSGGEHGAQLPTTSCRHITHADTTGDCNAHTLESNQKYYLLLSSFNKIFVCYVLSSLSVNIREGVKHVACPIFTFPVIV